MDAGLATMSPGDRNLLNFETELARQKQNLRIESPAFDFLKREDRLHCRLLEGFEAALRVFEFQPEREAQDQVEDSSEELTMQRLALRLGLGAQPAGTAKVPP